MTDFAHLHLHTQYSFLDGAIKVKDLMARVLELGMRSVAITDHGAMYGAMDFYAQAKAAGVKPIIGMEAYVTSVIGDVKHTDRVRENYHMVLLAKNAVGYRNLCALSSRAFLHGKYYVPRIDIDLLARHSDGIVATTACLGGEVGKRCAKGDLDGARASIQALRYVFGRNLYLEVQPNGMALQDRVNADIAQLGADEGVELVATNDCHYITRDQHEAQNVLMAIRQHLPLGDPKLHAHETDAFYVRSGEEMWSLLKGDYARAFENACEIARQCNVEIETGKTHLPSFPVPPKTRDEATYLRERAHEGLRRRLANARVDRAQYLARLNLELDIITKMGFAGYFLIVQDFIAWAKDNRIRVGPGRGSGAGSLVAYALRITDLDPIAHGLLFERFLNPERVSMPDFDVDFMQERRGEVIEYVAEKYGRERVGQIATYAGMNPKSAIKDVARAIGIDYGEVNALTREMPNLVDGRKPTFDESLAAAPMLEARARSDERYRQTLDVARNLDGLYRQAGVHAGGVVIGERPLVEYVPLCSGKDGEVVTQYDKDKAELAGLVKFDFLGLKTLDVIAHAEEMLRAQGVAIDIDALPLDDAATYELIARGDTLGVFQVESSGMIDMCRRLKPTCFEDIVAGVALYRPGPMDAGMLDDFIERKNGRREVTYLHPLLEPVLAPTYGTIVYQEQVMQAAQVIAGYSLGEADLLRRAMGKKKPEEMQKQKARFADGCAARGIDASTAEQLFDAIEKFAGYGFNKSHAAAYAVVTYQTAYLKAHHPAAFFAALLSTESTTEEIAKYAADARGRVAIKPPCVLTSSARFTVEQDGSVRFGLRAIQGVGEAAVDAIIEARKAGAFADFFDFCDRCEVNRTTVEAFIDSGAMDAFGARHDLAASIDQALSSASSSRKHERAGQASLFGGAPARRLARGRAWSPPEMARRQRAAIGVALSSVRQ